MERMVGQSRKEQDMRQGSMWGWRGALVAMGAVLALGVSVDASAATPDLKGKFEILKDEKSTHQPGKVKVIEFADFYCPHCHHFEETGLPLLVKEFGNRLEVTMVGFPVIRGKLPTAFDMYEQAKAMGKGNEMRAVLFRTIHKDKIDGVLDRSIRSLLIKEVGLDVAAFEAGLESGKPAKTFEDGRRWGERIKVSSTPSLLLDGNIKVDGANMTPENAITIIRSILENDAKK
jgi:thiol:disulfide interchange protein DsbA